MEQGGAEKLRSFPDDLGRRRAIVRRRRVIEGGHYRNDCWTLLRKGLRLGELRESPVMERWEPSDENPTHRDRWDESGPLSGIGNFSLSYHRLPKIHLRWALFLLCFYRKRKRESKCGFICNGRVSFVLVGVGWGEKTVLPFVVSCDFGK